MPEITRASLEEALSNDERLSKAAEEYAKAIASKDLDIAVMVANMGFALTADSAKQRASGVKLISRTLANLPNNTLNEMHLQTLSDFYANRLADQHLVIPAAIEGIAALVRMQNLPPACVTQLLQAFFKHTSCQSQMREERQKLYSTFKYLIEHFAAELQAMSGDFLYGLINSIDGERDPRNLDFIFTFMPDFMGKFPLLHLSEEMFEIFACYFPVDFNPSSSDPAAITRDALAQKLNNCLVATPAFAEWTVALALEKCESDLVSAKLDSLELLNQAALKFPAATMQDHFQQIWQVLKPIVFPGVDNADVLSAGLQTLRSLLENAAADLATSQNQQTLVLGVILTHLGDAHQRLFEPATTIALVCVAAHPAFAADKVLNCFLLKLEEPAEQVDVEQRIKMYTVTAQIFKICACRQALELLAQNSICQRMQNQLIDTLRQTEEPQNLDVNRAALSALHECVPLLSESNRAFIYQALLQFINSETVDLEFKFLLEQLGALHPIELQTHFIDACISNFGAKSKFVKQKVYANLLPLVKQLAFTQRVLDLVLNNVFNAQAAAENSVDHILAFEALNSLLRLEDKRFIEELQNNNSLIDRLVTLMRSTPQLNYDALSAAATALSLIMQQLPIAEQYMIVSTFLPVLHLQTSADLFVAQGLLSFLHEDITLDDHLERLLQDLTQLTLSCVEERERTALHMLICSLVNKMKNTESNRTILRKIKLKLQEELKLGKEAAAVTLAWMGKALIMAGDEEAGDIIEDLSQLLEHPTLAHTAVLTFDIISAEYPGIHLPVVRFLYKQKLFHMVLSKMGAKLLSFSSHHLNAFVFVLKTTPHAVLKLNLEKVAPLLFKCLETNQSTYTICIALEICANFIRQQDDYFRSHLAHIIPSCLSLSQHESSMKVRICSLELLYDITKYPIFVLLPYKMDVVLELARPLDDRKRLVRNAAVKARNAWYLIGAPNGMK